MALPHLELDDGEATLCEYVTISGTKYRIPIFKIAVGPAGTYVGDASSATPLPMSAGGQALTFGAGSVDAGTQRMTLAANDPAVVLLGGTGALKDAGTAFTVTRTHTVSADMTTTTAVSPAPASGQNIYVLDIFFSTDTTMNNIWEEETSGTDLLKGFFTSNLGIQQLTPRGEFKVPTADKKLYAIASVAGNVAHTIITRSA